MWSDLLRTSRAPCSLADLQPEVAGLIRTVLEGEQKRAMVTFLTLTSPLLCSQQVRAANNCKTGGGGGGTSIRNIRKKIQTEGRWSNRQEGEDSFYGGTTRRRWGRTGGGDQDNQDSEEDETERKDKTKEERSRHERKGLNTEPSAVVTHSPNHSKFEIQCW